MEAHEKASFTNTELHRAMNLHISNLRLLGGPLETLKEALPRPALSEGEDVFLKYIKVRLKYKVDILNKCLCVCRGSSRAAVHEEDPGKGAGNEGPEKHFRETAQRSHSAG